MDMAWQMWTLVMSGQLAIVQGFSCREVSSGADPIRR